ncbi:hypothetical protein CFK40_15965 [Virgibacillus necropolis]|uniref:Uncharacterized protein n=1 Tax=Virgibacillus necropolis TaxID=163877 RepID=A0A221MFG2_9BACI|nr:hypothetical protein CFK40_15965 [Virgibacillus necropolis]
MQGTILRGKFNGFMYRASKDMILLLINFREGYNHELIEKLHDLVVKVINVSRTIFVEFE